MEEIYERPRDYDLEHEGDDEDLEFYLRLLARWQPRRVMELAAGALQGVGGMVGKPAKGGSRKKAAA